MAKKTKIAKQWIVDKFVEADLVDERRIVTRIGFAVKPSKKETIGSIAKNVATVFAFGYYETTEAIPCMLGLQRGNFHIVPYQFNKRTSPQEIREKSFNFTASDIERIKIGKLVTTFTTVDGQDLMTAIDKPALDEIIDIIGREKVVAK